VHSIQTQVFSPSGLCHGNAFIAHPSSQPVVPHEQAL
jgi:hypothetical protein